MMFLAMSWGFKWMLSGLRGSKNAHAQADSQGGFGKIGTRTKMIALLRFHFQVSGIPA
jgi:hypothetical protein